MRSSPPSLAPPRRSTPPRAPSCHALAAAADRRDRLARALLGRRHVVAGAHSAGVGAQVEERVGDELAGAVEGDVADPVDGEHARAARPIFRIKFAPGDYVAAIAMNARIIRTSVRWLTQTTVSSISIT